MNTRKKAIVYVGVDISKDTFNSAIGKRDGIHTNSTDGFIAFCADLRRVKGVPHVVFEHTGRYSRPLRDFLTENKMGFTLVDPKQARNFVKGDKEAKRLAKTDKIDARMLALMGIRQNLEQTGAADKAQERIIEWQNQRKALVESCSRLKTLRESLADQELLRFNADAIAELGKAIETCDARIAELIKESPVRSGLVNALMAVHGVGSIVATTLVASIPELGKVNRAKIAAIVGVAPKVAESGKRKGQCYITGGREYPRKMLYLATRAACRDAQGVLGRYYASLLVHGKCKKSATVACMRKLIIHLNTIAKSYLDTSNLLAA